MIKVIAPGKLYIAGEYAVVDGMPSIVVALNQYITVEISAGHKYGSIISKQYQASTIYWRREGNQMIFDNRDNPFCYILSAIKITEQYARSLHVKLGLYHLKIDSQLDSPDGKKYGLGSSAAVTVATINALCVFYHIPINKEQLFKLSAIAHFSVQGNGSLGDIAASVYGGWIAFRTFDHQWLKIMQRNSSIKTLINMPWPNLKIEQLTVPESLQLLIGWTGTPASTSHLVDKVSLGRAHNPEKYNQFLKASKKCLIKMIHGFREGSLKLIKHEIAVNRKLLNQLGDFTKVDIETPQLKKLSRIAIHYGGSAKSSGAGGGDCGITVVNRQSPIKQILDEWKQNHIQPLKFKVTQQSSGVVHHD
ncbi:phosphomevalonate kinase [uncultured bacterium]|nr:phosphomevalonate kinase [uncultured bacterium]